MQSMIDAIHPALPSTQIPPDEQAVTLGEIKHAIRKGGNNKAPGPDGIGTAFYKENWETVKVDLCDVLNQMMLHEATETQQNQGIIVYLPKPNGTQTPEGYRPITLLSTDYKSLARIIARRIRPVMKKLRESRFCGVPGNNIFDAVTTIREATAQAEVTPTPLCVLSLDFREAFDKISHRYLFAILDKYAIGKCVITGIKNLYAKATSSVQINGYISGPTPIQCSIRQGCPMSMQLYVLCLHPLLTLLNEKVARLQIGRNGRRIAAVAYADDVTHFVTSPNDLPTIKDTIHTFEKASGARLNPHKSKALAIAGWDATDTGLGIEFQPYIRILGATFTNTIARSAQLSWERLTGLIRAQARLAYARKLCITQRLQYVQTLCWPEYGT